MARSYDTPPPIIPIVICLSLLMGVMVGFISGLALQQRVMQRQAVNVGVAERDPQTGEFRWKGKE